MQKRRKMLLFGFWGIFLLQQVLLLTALGYFFRTTGKQKQYFGDMESELDEEILAARKKAFGKTE